MVFLTNQVTLAENLEVSRNGRVKADSMMQSNIEGLYVAGDASDYPGKLPLMSLVLVKQSMRLMP